MAHLLNPTGQLCLVNDLSRPVLPFLPGCGLLIVQQVPQQASLGSREQSRARGAREPQGQATRCLTHH